MMPVKFFRTQNLSEGAENSEKALNNNAITRIDDNSGFWQGPKKPFSVQNSVLPSNFASRNENDLPSIWY